MAPAMSSALVAEVHGRIAVAVFALLLISACVSDIRTRRIPNVLVGCVAVCGLLYSIGESPWRAGVMHALGGLGVGFLIWAPFYALRVIGAGDAKFFAAAATWLGARSALQAAALTALLGAALAVYWMVRTDGWRGAVARASLGVQRPLPASASGADVAPDRRLRVPYGVAMAAGLAAAAWLPRPVG